MRRSRGGAQLASDSSGAEDVNGTESDVESLGTYVHRQRRSGVRRGANRSPAGATSSWPAAVRRRGHPRLRVPAPAGCLQVAEDTTKSTATYAFNGCTGPLGPRRAHGHRDRRLAAAHAGNELTLDYSAQGFQVNRATIDNWQATAVIT